MAFRRSNNFDANIDPALLKALEAVGSTYSPYDVEVFSGYRPGDPRFHGKGSAADVNLINRETGTALDNYQGGGATGDYQAYANAVYQWAQKNDPALAQKLRWGGYFGGDKGKYGALDLMHFDVGGGEGGVGMAGGSWQGGFTPEMMQTWDIAQSGGLGGQAQAMAAAGYSPEQIRKAFLSTIASGESPGYDVVYGGEKFSDMSKHPGRMMPILDKQGQVTGHSDAAGRYQFLGSTWDEQAKKYGYKDFSPETQDLAAWNYAGDIYKTKTGGSLEEALKSGDPARINAAAQILNKTWSSLPGGAEQGKGYGDKSFYDIYQGHLGPASEGSGGGDAPVQGPPVADPSLAKTKPEGTDWDAMLSSGLSGLGTSGAKLTKLPTSTTTPAPVRAPAMAAPGASGGIDRDALALAMARLNTGQLWG